MTSEQEVRKRHKNAVIGIVAGDWTYRVYKNERFRANERLCEAQATGEEAWDRAAENVGQREG